MLGGFDGDEPVHASRQGRDIVTAGTAERQARAVVGREETERLERVVCGTSRN